MENIYETSDNIIGTALFPLWFGASESGVCGLYDSGRSFFGDSKTFRRR